MIASYRHTPHTQAVIKTVKANGMLKRRKGGKTNLFAPYCSLDSWSECLFVFVFFFFPLAEFSFESLTCRYCCRGKVQNFVQWLQINLIVFILQKIFNDANAKLVLVQF